MSVVRMLLLCLFVAAGWSTPAGGQQTTAELQPPAASPQAHPQAQSADADYVLGADDVVEVNLLGQPEFRTRARIRSDGTILLPFLNAVMATGQTPLALGDSIAAALRSGGFYNNPAVSVDIVSYSSRYVIVLGEVAQPGLQPVNRAYRLSEILARAGGLRSGAAAHVVLTRANATELKLPFGKIATGFDASDPMVQPGDKIFIPAAELFYIYGQVNAPGVYPIQEELTVRMALARGGGLTASGSDKRVRLYVGGQSQNPDLERRVQPGDVIVVGERLF